MLGIEVSDQGNSQKTKGNNRLSQSRINRRCLEHTSTNRHARGLA